MSWSISQIGKHDAVKAAVAAQTPPTEEHEKAQFEAARALVSAQLDAFAGSNGVQVEASGYLSKDGQGRVVVLVESKSLAGV